MKDERTAILYRMELPDHVCPYGLRARHLLEANGYAVEEHVLRSREEVDAYKAEQGVPTTPQIFIADECIGGCHELEQFLASETAQ